MKPSLPTESLAEVLVAHEWRQPQRLHLSVEQIPLVQSIRKRSRAAVIRDHRAGESGFKIRTLNTLR